MDLRQKIQTLLAAPNYHPLRRAELAAKLHLSASERRDYRRLLAEMLECGELARVRNDRFVRPEEADLVIGRITINEKGFGFVIPERPPTETRDSAFAKQPATADKPEPGSRKPETVNRGPRTAPDIYVAEQDTAVAMHGDKVVVRLTRERRQFREADKPAGRVIRILERANDTIVGTLQKTVHFHYLIPDDPRLIRDIYTKPALNARVGDKVVVKLAEWKTRHVNPEGEIIEVLGKADAPGVDIAAIIRQHHLATRFSDQVVAETERLPTAIPAAEYQRRRDLRAQFIVTIDPDDAKDFDDAVNVDELPDGGWRLGVHIADVSHYVPPGSALDREAEARGNSVYLVDRVLPMLPEKLSNGLCSLRPQEDRLTQSCFIEFTPKLTVRKTEFALSIIRSRHRLTYKEAFARLSSGQDKEAGRGSSAFAKASADQPDPAACEPRCRGSDAAHGALRTDRRSPTTGTDDELTGELKKMWRLAAQLRHQRFAHGALALDFPEVKVRLDENGQPTKIEKIYYDISHQLIEEFMLAANEAVARHLCQLQIPCLYRIHEDPDLEKLRDFRVYAQSFGYKVGDLTHRQELQKLLAAVEAKPEQYAINLALLRSLKQARYSPSPVGHYGLAKKFYTHFTSPIRRYADLVVHRTLLAVMPPVAGTGFPTPPFGAGLQTAPSAATVRSPGRYSKGDLRSDGVRGQETRAQHPTAPPTQPQHRYSLGELARIGEHISQTERIADEAEKESVELKKLEYFQRQLLTGQLAPTVAVVCGVRNFGIFVELPDSLVQGLVHVSTIEDDFYHYDEQRERLVGKRTKRIIQIGDHLTVQVARVDIFKRQIDFRLVG